jgi:GMP synthase-like glutamine amidotransferase
MKALLLQHTKTSNGGTTFQWFETRKVDYQIAFLPDVSSLPSLESFDLLVICGGGMNVDQEHLHPWLKFEKAFIRQAIEAQKKIVGLCLGSQLIAEVLGAKVGPHSDWETGWHQIQFVDGKKMTVFEWHAYTFAVPAGAERIATNSNCPSQAYRYGNNVMAFQFHPEATEQWILDRVNDPKAPTSGFVQTKEQVLEGMANRQIMQDWYFEKLDQLMQSEQLPLKLSIDSKL